MTKQTSATLEAVYIHTQVNLNSIYNIIYKWENYLLMYVFALCKNYARDG